MVTSRSEPIDIPSLTPEASDCEAAAIAAAVSAYLSEETTDSRADDDDEDWSGKRWRVAGRIAAVSGREVDIPHGVSKSAWVAADRVSRT